jgi:hypothetical protein
MDARTSATASHDGFLLRNLSQVPATKIGYSLQESTEHRAAEDYFIITPLSDVQEGVRSGDVEGSKWNTRGWTMQERSLSTRSIHFCKNKIYYECRESLRSEENEPEESHDYSPFHMWPRSPAKGGTAEPATIWLDLWRRAVRNYSRRKLTVPSDKLPAISSLASDIRAREPTLHFWPGAGVWEEDLAQQLLWYVESGKPRRPPVVRAPSWSWASLDASISFVKGTRTCPNPDPLHSQLPWITTLHPTPGGKHLLIVEAITINIAIIQEAKTSDRHGYSHELQKQDGTICGHAILDFQDQKTLTSGLSYSGATETRLIYLHLANHQHPSGLIVLREELHSKNLKRPRDTRIGVATIFELGGSSYPHSILESEGVRSRVFLHDHSGQDEELNPDEYWHLFTLRTSYEEPTDILLG